MNTQVVWSLPLWLCLTILIATSLAAFALIRTDPNRWTSADKRAFMAQHKSVSLGYDKRPGGHVVEMFGPPGSEPLPACPQCGLINRAGHTCD